MNFFSDFLQNPIITLFLAGFYVRDIFIGWGLPSLGWILCIVITVFMVLKTLLFVSFVYRSIKKIFRSFRE